MILQEIRAYTHKPIISFSIIFIGGNKNNIIGVKLFIYRHKQSVVATLRLLHQDKFVKRRTNLF